MANLTIKFNNKEFLLSCEDGQEEHLEELSIKINQKFNDLKNNLGNLGENKLLLITAVKIMDEYYDNADFKKLESGIEKVCEDLKHSVFGDTTELEKKDWIRQVLMPDLKWLSKFDSIRKKVHEASGVPLLHINEQEAKKLLERLQKEQDKVREQALNEELEVKQREQVLLNYLEP